MGLGQPGVADAMRRYSETYAFDDAGNMLELAHHSGGEARPDWTRIFQYDEPSLLDPAQRSNRLTRTQFADRQADTFSYDENGNVTVMPHLPSMRWDERNRLQATTPPPHPESSMGTTHYRYDIAGQRVRKITEREASAGQLPSRGKETIYLADVEIRREYQGDGVTVDLEHETLHIEYGGTRFALIETRIRGEDGQPDRVIRFQHENQVESSVLELGENAQVLSLEEYYPYGLTSFMAVRDSADPPKRYRYTGKERDSESSLYYHGARYYVPWLARWTSVDPLYLDFGTSEGHASQASGSPIRPRDVTSHGFSSPSRSSQPSLAAQAHANPYVYVDNRPIVARDPDGKDAVLIAYPDFRPEIPHVGRPLALGHAGILLIDNKTGLTKYYEYGRYDKADLGLVRTQTVPNVVIRDGRPTPESLNAVLSRLSTVAGHGGRIRAAYIESSQFDEMDRAAQAHLAQNSNPHRKAYAITDNNCATFAEQIARTDPGVAHPWLIINTSPNNIVDEYIEEGHREINFTPTSSSHAPSHRATPKGKPHTTPSQAPGRPPQHGPQHKGVHQIPTKPTKPIHR
jgi:RHS repeat-associated protein